VVPVFFSLIKWSVHIREVTYQEFRKESAPRSQETKRMIFLLRKSPLAIIGLIMIGTLLSLALLAPVIAPEHWDPKYAEVPNAQPYFKLMPPSLSVSQQYDLYAKHIYSVDPDENNVEVAVDTFGKGYLTAKADVRYGSYSASTGISNVTAITVLPQSVVLDRTEISPKLGQVAVKEVFALTAHSFSTEGKEMDASYTWSVDQNVGYVSMTHGKKVLFQAGATSETKGTIALKASYNGVEKETSIPVEITGAPGPWSVAYARTHNSSSFGFIGYPKKLSVQAFASNGTMVPPSQYNVTWKIVSQSGGTSEDLYAVSIPSKFKGYTVGVNGTILRSDDGGRTWKLIAFPSSITLTDVSFSGASVVWVVGKSGAIYNTSDAGNKWFKQNSTATDALHAVWFNYATEKGWAAGANGTILNTSNSGVAWNKQSSGTNVTIRDIEFSQGMGFAVGDSGTILKTSDWGATWAPLPSGVNTSLVSIEIIDKNRTYICGKGGMFLRTTDGGSTWTKLDTGTSADILGLEFFDSSVGLASGSGGLLLRTTSGGDSWEPQVSNTTKDLYSIAAQKGIEDLSVIVGARGTILEKENNTWVQTKTRLKAIYGNETEVVTSSPGDVKVSASVKAGTGEPIVLNCTIYVLSETTSPISKKIEGSPSEITVKRGELIPVNVTIRDNNGNGINETSITWAISGELVTLRVDDADVKGDNPSSSTERVVVEGARSGRWLMSIVNRGSKGPFYLRALGFYLVPDVGNSSYAHYNVFMNSTGENMDTDPIQRDEVRTYQVDLDKPLQELHIDLIGPKPYLFGTDENGRDYASLILYGTGISMRIAIVVVVSALLIGTLLGGVSGYFGGKMDEVLMRITDVFLSIPGLILAMGVAAVLGRSLDNIMYALIIVWWPGYTRLVRGQALSIRENLYVEAARAVGASETRIIIKHIIPNCLSAVLVNATLDIGAAVLVAAGLSFIGFGALFPVPELGLLISTGRQKVFTAPWLVTLPGLAIFVFVLGFNLFGDGLRDLLDPRLRE
jgi:peptide/nickel transport system permease protein